jgi:hypothetical protein
MPITDISVTDIANFADGHEFGAAGAYVRIKGVARGVLDPAAPANAGIVDLDKAPTISAGFVEYATDFDILRPKDALRGSGILVYDVPNRGSKRIFNLLDDFVAGDPARTNDPKTREDAGLGFCLGRGYSIVWVGLGPRRAARQWRSRRRVSRRARQRPAGHRPHPRRVPLRHQGAR